MGLLAAVRQWYKRDHDAEQRMWRGWLQTYRGRACNGLPSVSYRSICSRKTFPTRPPRLRIRWDAERARHHRHRTGGKAGCRHAAHPAAWQRRAAPDQMASSVIIMPYMMDPGEERIIADAMYAA